MNVETSGQPGGWGPHQAPPRRRSNTALVVTLISVGVVLVLGLVAAGVIMFFVLNGSDDAAERGGPGGVTHDDAAEHGGPEGVTHIEGVQYFEVEATHTEDPVDYAQTPPAGGEHHPQWLNCGVYTDPVPAEHAVHAQEHGAVWITYQPDLPPDEVERLTSLHRNGSYLVISPYPDLPEPVVLSAWSSQLAVDSAEDDRITDFLEVYEQAEFAPEPGAPCSGGVDP
ncbi:hypothetical protein F4561_000839 [Lipingzhangella halophila]|uniref:DUF3105 domain-containing protein n=1 Tax=Lipingzhangella halophila TaxID=1783352 RepID=A0A7W7RDJ7_9ACTN|nr:DUF3105 domain-containing protein [Lipingzhangella halophila]MBB4930019.1 hypothetical protein [Lipingzhangella halophila]